MRSYKKSVLSWGMLTIPVRWFSVRDDAKTKFRWLHRGDNAPIQNQRVCSLDGNLVPFEEIVNGYEVSKGNFVTFTNEELDNLPLPGAGAITVLGSWPVDRVAILQREKPIYLGPDTGGQQAYKILQASLAQTGRGVFGKVQNRGRELTVFIEPLEDVLVLWEMAYAAEVRDWRQVPDLPMGLELSKRDLETGVRFVQMMEMEFDPAEIVDDFEIALRGLIEAKAQGVVIPAPVAPAPTPGPTLADAMQKMMAELKTERGKKPAVEKKKAGAKKG